MDRIKAADQASTTYPSSLKSLKMIEKFKRCSAYTHTHTFHAVLESELKFQNQGVWMINAMTL